MNPQDLDEQISKAQADELKILEAAKQHAAQVVEVIKGLVGEWYESATRDAVKANPQTVMAMANAGVASMKANLQALIETAPSLVDVEFNKPFLWPHEDTTTLFKEAASTSAMRNQSPSAPQVDTAISALSHPLGHLLDQYHLLDTTPGGGWMTLWYGSDQSSKRYHFGRGFDRSKVTQAMRPYLEDLVNLISMHSKLEKLQRQKQEHDALDMFDKA